MMSVIDLQYGVFLRPVSNISNIQAPANIECIDIKWLNVTSKEDTGYKNEFQYKLRFAIDYTETLDSPFADIYNYIFIKFQACQLPAKPDGFFKGLISTMGKNLITELKGAITALTGDVETGFQEAAFGKINNAKESVAKIASDKEAYKAIRDEHLKLFKIIDDFAASTTDKERIKNILLSEDIFLKIVMLKTQENAYNEELALDYMILKKYISGEIPKTDELPKTKDYFNAVLGTGFLEDLFKYIKNQFYK